MHLQNPVAASGLEIGFRVIWWKKWSKKKITYPTFKGVAF